MSKIKQPPSNPPKIISEKSEVAPAHRIPGIRFFLKKNVRKIEEKEREKRREAFKKPAWYKTSFLFLYYFGVRNFVVIEKEKKVRSKKVF